jgi:hypothetical protein
MGVEGVRVLRAVAGKVLAPDLAKRTDEWTG